MTFLKAGLLDSCKVRNSKYDLDSNVFNYQKHTKFGCAYFPFPEVSHTGLLTMANAILEQRF